MADLSLTIEHINSLSQMGVVHDAAVKERFIELYNTLWVEGGEKAYERESRYFDIILGGNESIRNKCVPFSIFTSFLDLAVCGLSLEPGAKALCYLQPRSVAVGKGADGATRYEGRCTLVVSGYGELVLRARAGQIKYADNPVLVYDEDNFRFSDNDGRKSVQYTCNLPHASNHIVAAFMRIVRNDGSSDYAVMFEEDWLRLADFSARNNRKWDKASGQYVAGDPNVLYVSNNGRIDSGFLCAKLIKHAFKTYPKVRIGRGTELQSMQEPQSEEQDYYGVDLPEPPAQPRDPNPAFGAPATGIAQGVKVDPEDDGAF